MEIIRNSPAPQPGENGRVSRSGEVGEFGDASYEGLSQDGMEITAIKPAVKNTHRVNVFVDGKFSFSLDLMQLADFKLKVGQRLSEERLSELISASNFGKLYTRTLEYVFMRPRSIREVRDYLRKKQHAREVQQKPGAQISNGDIEAVVERLVERGYLNDANFARYYIENRNISKGISEKRLRLELRKKGVSDRLIEQALSEVPRDQGTEIEKMIAKKRRRGYDDQKLIQYLLRQGFDYELVRNLVLSEKD